MNIAKTILISLLFIPLLVFAQNQAVLPSAGLTPESPFYFFDKFGEALREFFTFNPEGKARLQITFAAERVAEIKVILETKGIQAPGLEIAQSRLQAHLTNAVTIVTEQKSEGKNVSALAKELDSRIDTSKSALNEIFEEKEKVLEAQEKELRRKILEARQAGDLNQINALVQQLGQVKAQKELLELEEEETEDALEQEEERLEEQMEAKEKAEKAIKEAEKEKQEIIDEAAEEDITLLPGVFGRFDGILMQAKSALVAGNYQEAKRLAKQAEKSLDDIEKTIEELEEAKEKEEELKEEQEEREREAREEQEEKAKEESESENNNED